MSDLTGVAGKVANLTETVERLDKELEATKTRSSALEIKAATAGKLGLSEMLKIAGLVISLTTVISALIQVYVKGNQAEGLRELRETQAVIAGEIRSMTQRLESNETALGKRTEWMQDYGATVSSVEARVMGLENLVEVSSRDRWTSNDHENYSNALKRELELIWKVLDAQEKGGGK